MSNPFAEAILHATSSATKRAEKAAAEEEASSSKNIINRRRSAEKSSLFSDDDKPVPSSSSTPLSERNSTVSSRVASSKKQQPIPFKNSSRKTPRQQQRLSGEAWAAKTPTASSSSLAPAASTQKRAASSRRTNSLATPRRALTPAPLAEDGVEKLRRENEKLRRENFSLNARLKARLVAATKEEDGITSPAAAAPQQREERREEEAPHITASPAVAPKEERRTTQSRYSCGEHRYSRRRASSLAAVCGGGPVANSPLELRRKKVTEKTGCPLVALGVYGCAAADGECAARLLPAHSGAGVFFNPAQLAAVSSGDDEVPWAALSSLACPDGLSLRQVSSKKKQSSPWREHIAVLRAADGSRVYLICCSSVAETHFARPTAVARTLKIAAAENQVNHLLGTPLRSSGGVKAATPLSDAKHLLAPSSPAIDDEDDDDSESEEEVGEKLFFLGQRTYAALTRDERSCGQVLTFLRRAPQVEEQASPKSSWAEAWEEASKEGVAEEEDQSSSPTTSKMMTRQLERLVSRCASDSDLWRRLTDVDDISRKETEVPLETASWSVEDWAVAATFSLLPCEVVAKCLLALLREQSIVAVAEDLSRSSAVALGLATLLAPLKWQGALITALPLTDLELLSSPVPFIAGCSTSTAAAADAHFAHEEAELNDLCVLYVDRQHEAQFVCATRSKPLEGAVPRSLVRSLQAATATLERGASPSRILVAPTRAERAAAANAREAARNYITSLLGDLNSEKDAWKICGEHNLESEAFDFVPEWFLAPLEAKIALQRDLAHTQMLVSHVHALREAANDK